jgi:hypothetical protein
MGQITITFAGICAHFRDGSLLPPDVQHRVVLPTVATFRMGIVQPPGFGFLPYFLQPHYPIFKRDGTLVKALEHILANGYLMRPCRVTVANAVVNQPLGAFPSDIPQLTKFVARYEPSPEVVSGKRAVCHFDVEHGGEFSVNLGLGGALNVNLKIQTMGAPIVMFTPLDDDIPPQSLTFELDEATLQVFNAEPQPTRNISLPEDTPYDFLLHYETSTRGIGQRLTATTPGMDANSIARFPFSGVRDALVSLADTVDELTATPSPRAMAALTADVLNPSCSNSQYP